MKERESAILRLLSEHGRMEVMALARTLEVSAVTVRKDLDELERRGVIRREHGCAIFGGNDDVKRRIAKEAAKLVAVGETVMIENGSCCALLAEEIARSRPGAVIITNSAFIASFIRRIDGAHVVLLGGDFQNDAQVMVGPVLRTCAEQFYVDKLFIGVDGYNERLGFMSNNHLRAQAVRDMARQELAEAKTEKERLYDQLRILRCLRDGAMQVDDLIEAAELPAQRVLSALTMLEIDGYIQQFPGKRYTRLVNVRDA